MVHTVSKKGCRCLCAFSCAASSALDTRKRNFDAVALENDAKPNINQWHRLSTIQKQMLYCHAKGTIVEKEHED
jgi:hypothetical protein